MRLFFHSISFRFWLPFAILALLIIVVAGFYLPDQQKRLVLERKKIALRESGQALALGIELSLDFEDLNSIKKSVEFIKKNAAFTFIGVIIKDSASSYEELLAAFPEDKSYLDIVQVDSTAYLYEDVEFISSLGNGYVRIAESREQIDLEIQKINQPIYLSLILSAPLFLLLLFFLSYTTARPVLKLTRLVQNTERNLLKQSIPLSTQKSEIAVLQNSFASLVTVLQKKNTENEALINNQELLVKARTLELEIAQKKLVLSQRRAKIGHYEVFLPTLNWESSETLDEILGLDKAFLKNNRGLMQLIPYDYRHKIFTFWETGNTDVYLDTEIEVVHQKTQLPVWIRIIGEKTFDNKGKTASITGIIQDISEEMKFKEEIRRLSLVAEYTSNLVLITDSKRKILWANNSLLKVTGYELKEILGKTPSIFQYEKTDKNTIAYINAKLLRKEIISKIEVQNRGKHGNEYWLELNIVPLLDDQKNVTGYIAVENEITLRKQYEEGLKSINKDLELKMQESMDANIRLSRAVNDYEKMAAIGEMAAGVAHDLNTPISTIMVGAETLQYVLKEIFEKEVFLLKEEEWRFITEIIQLIQTESFVTGSQMMKEKKEMREYLTASHPEIPESFVQSFTDQLVRCRIHPHQTDLIRQFLKFEKALILLRVLEHLQTINTIVQTIDSSVTKSTNVIKNLRSYIKNEEENIRQPILLLENIKSVLSIFKLDMIDHDDVVLSIPPDLMLYGNEIKLFQLWSNLIKNAMEAMKDQADKKLIIHAEKLPDKILVCFENNGPVIPPADLEKIFKVFYSTKEKQGGSGLGLSIVKRIVQEHKAKLEVSSVPGKTLFAISFPPNPF